MELQAAAFNKLLKMARSILAGCQMGIRTFGTEKRDAGGMGIDLIQMLLEQRLLSQNGVFDDQLETGG